jgi:hypothetical protein
VRNRCRSARTMDEELPVAYNRISREQFYADACRRVENAVRGARLPRERRLAEREAILSTMEQYGLIRRTRGDQEYPETKPERIWLLSKYGEHAGHRTIDAHGFSGKEHR